MKSSSERKQKDFTDNREVLITAKMLEKRIDQLGKQITKDYEGKNLTVICNLKGAVYFFTDLTKKIRLDTKMEFIRVSSYEGENSTGNVKFKVKLDEPVTGKDVLVIEDIIDTGNTLAETLKYFEAQKPSSLRLCVLLDKPERRIVEGIKVDYLGFTIPNRFVIGYGLDLDEKFRNLPDIQCIVRSEEEHEQIKKDKETLKLQLK